MNNPLSQKTVYNSALIELLLLEVRMPTCLVSLLVVVLAIPVLGQHSDISRRINQTIDSRERQISQVVTDPTPADRNRKAARLEAIHHDAGELAALSESVQSDLQALGNGLLAKDLNIKLKKLEKLSKKLRQEVNP